MNGDGDLDAKDVVAVAHHLGNKKGYNANADVNGDGAVTVKDLHIVIDCRFAAKHGGGG